MADLIVGMAELMLLQLRYGGPFFLGAAALQAAYLRYGRSASTRSFRRRAAICGLSAVGVVPVASGFWMLLGRLPDPMLIWLIPAEERLLPYTVIGPPSLVAAAVVFPSMVWLLRRRRARTRRAAG